MKYILKNKKTELYHKKCIDIKKTNFVVPGMYDTHYFCDAEIFILNDNFMNNIMFTPRYEYDTYEFVRYDQEQIIYLKKQRKKKLEKIYEIYS